MCFSNRSRSPWILEPWVRGPRLRCQPRSDWSSPIASMLQRLGNNRARNSGHRAFRHGQGDGQTQATLKLSSNFNLIWRSDFPPNKDFGGAPGGFSSARATTDPELVRQAIAVLSAYLEQAGSQLEHRGAERRLASAAKGNGRLRMSREEALDVLGLEATASAREIAEAHRRLGERLDPQVGGTHYLSMKIDEARDVLLGQ